MVVLHSEHTVADYDQWRAAFRSHEDNRKAHGATGHRILRNGNALTVLTEFPDRASALRFLADPALQSTIAVAGFTTPPRSIVLDCAEQSSY